MSATDLSLIALAGGGVIGWILIRQPIVAVGCVIAADMIGVAMMTPKVRRDPHSETLATYALASVGGALATGAVGMLVFAARLPRLLLPGERRTGDPHLPATSRVFAKSPLTTRWLGRFDT